jgi:hypothetical protein
MKEIRKGVPTEVDGGVKRGDAGGGENGVVRNDDIAQEAEELIAVPKYVRVVGVERLQLRVEKSRGVCGDVPMQDAMGRPTAALCAVST